jgi:hypothetical protein
VKKFDQGQTISIRIQELVQEELDLNRVTIAIVSPEQRMFAPYFKFI